MTSRGSLKTGIHTRYTILASIVLLVLFNTGCGEDFTHPIGPPPGDPAPLPAVFDILASYPAFEFPEFSAFGLELDMTVEVDPATVKPGGGPIGGKVTIHDARVAGISRGFQPTKAFRFSGSLSGNMIVLRLRQITVGMTRLTVELDGIVDSAGSTMAGLARFANQTGQGTWSGIKQRRYLIAGSAFGLQGTASVVTVRFGNRFTVDQDVELISGDPIAASSKDSPLIVNRLFFDNVQVLDPENDFLTAVQFSTGNGSNPHDALSIRGGDIYISRYEPPFNDILIADPDTGDSRGTIPLAHLATNISGTPRPDRMIRTAGLVVVTLQNVDTTFQDYGPGILAFIDPGTGSLLSSIHMDGTNPFGPLSVHPETGDIFVAAAGIFQGLLPRELSGGIEVIDPVSMSTRGILVDDDDLGGNVAGVAVAGGGRAYAVVVDSAGHNAVVAFNPGNGAIIGNILSTTSFIPEIRYDGDGFLLVAEADFGNPGLRIFDAATGAQIVRLQLSLPPVSMAILTRGVIGVP